MKRIVGKQKSVGNGAFMIRSSAAEYLTFAAAGAVWIPSWKCATRTKMSGEERLGGFPRLWNRKVLQDAGKGTAELARAHAESEFEKCRIVQDRLFESDFVRMVKRLDRSVPHKARRN